MDTATMSTSNAAITSDSVLARFIGAVLDDVELQAQLGAIESDEDFRCVALESARARGFELAPETITAAIRPDPLGLSRFQPAPVTLERWPARGWMPSRSVATAGAPMLDWAWMGSARLTAPFYEDEVRRASFRPFSRMFRTRTSLDALIEAAPSSEPAVPDGLIFHLSRCGSTLVSQMLAAVPHHIVASEPEPLDAVVQWASTSDAPLERQVAALRAIADAIGRDRGDGARRFFLKLDSWHVTALPLFRAAFPDTPWIFLYRDPVEIMVSQMRVRGLQTVAGGLPPHVFAIANGEHMPGEHYCAEVLRRTCAAVLEHGHLGGGMAVNYAELPEAMATRIPAHFGFAPEDGESAAMAATTPYNAKAPRQSFAADGERKRAEASDAIRHAVARQIAPVYAELEALRLAQQA